MTWGIDRRLRHAEFCSRGPDDPVRAGLPVRLCTCVPPWIDLRVHVPSKDRTESIRHHWVFTQ